GSAARAGSCARSARWCAQARGAATAASCSRSLSESVLVGRVGRPHGLDGSFFVEDASDDPARFAVGATLYVRGEPLRIAASKSARGRPVIRLELPVHRGEELRIPRAELPEPGEGAYFVFQLVGLEVVEEG